MSEERKTFGEPGDLVELKDKEAGFTDPETLFDISRDQRVELGSSVGKATQQAIMSGGLLIVNDKPSKGKAAKEAADEKVAK